MGHWKNIYLIWNWVCSCECTPQTTVSLQADILFRASDTLQRLLGEMIHVFFTAVGMNVPCGCLVNHDSSLERCKLSQSYQEVPFSINIIITINMPVYGQHFCVHTCKIYYLFFQLLLYNWPSSYMTAPTLKKTVVKIKSSQRKYEYSCHTPEDKIKGDSW